MKIAKKNFLISVKRPVYVAEFDLGVLPIGDWSTSITLSMKFNPETDLKGKGAALLLYTSL